MGIQLTKNELKKQRDSLKLFSRYLPTLQLKKQQLQLMLRTISDRLADTQREFEEKTDRIAAWVAVLGEPSDIDELVRVLEVKTEVTSIAGIEISVFKNIVFVEASYDLLVTPLWVDTAVEAIRELLTLTEKVRLLKKQQELLREEHLTTSQRVNLFERVKIPDAQQSIRRIQIYLGDLQTAAVVRGKLSKRKLAEQKF